MQDTSKPNPQGYGPLNMIYTSVTAGDLITSLSATTPSTALQGVWRGMGLRTGPKGLLVTELGRYQNSGNNDWHQLVIVQAKAAAGDIDDRSKIVAQTVIRAGGMAGTYAWGKLTQPVMLAPNTNYFVVSYEDGRSDSYLGNCTSIQYNASNSANTDAQKLYGYAGSKPGDFSPDNLSNPGFIVDGQAWYLGSSNTWIRDNSASHGGVNLRVQ